MDKKVKILIAVLCLLLCFFIGTTVLFYIRSMEVIPEESTFDPVTKTQDDGIDTLSPEYTDDNSLIQNDNIFIINDSGKQLTLTNGWKVTSAYTKTATREDQSGFGGIYLVPITSHWIIEKDEATVEYIIEYIAPGTMGLAPTGIDPRFEPVEKLNDLTLMRKSSDTQDEYEYLFAFENDKFGITEGDDIFYPDVRYYVWGPVDYFIFKGSEDTQNEAEKLILNIKANFE